MQSALKPEVFRKLYRDFLPSRIPSGTKFHSSAGADVYKWDEKSTYVQGAAVLHELRFATRPNQRNQRCPSARDFRRQPHPPPTTSHPPAVSKRQHPAGKYLLDNGVTFEDFNSYGSRRGNDRVMTRGTFANVRIKNLMVPGVEGGVTKYQPGGEQTSIYDAAIKYAEHHTPLIVIAGQESLGTGSSRDWAAKEHRAPRGQSHRGAQLRAHPPLQPRRHGRVAVAIQGRRHRANPKNWTAPKMLRYRRPRRESQTAART